MSGSEWIWRASPRGSTVTCVRCAMTLSGDPDAIARLQASHDPDVCVVRAQTPAARRARGGR